MGLFTNHKAELIANIIEFLGNRRIRIDDDPSPPTPMLSIHFPGSETDKVKAIFLEHATKLEEKLRQKFCYTSFEDGNFSRTTVTIGNPVYDEVKKALEGDKRWQEKLAREKEDEAGVILNPLPKKNKAITSLFYCNREHLAGIFFEMSQEKMLVITIPTQAELSDEEKNFLKHLGRNYKTDRGLHVIVEDASDTRILCNNLKQLGIEVRDSKKESIFAGAPNLSLTPPWLAKLELQKKGKPDSFHVLSVPREGRTPMMVLVTVYDQLQADISALLTNGHVRNQMASAGVDTREVYRDKYKMHCDRLGEKVDVEKLEKTLERLQQVMVVDPAAIELIGKSSLIGSQLKRA